jgi:hypothetical protein
LLFSAAMDSPYRSSELEVVHSAGRADKRCGASTDACKRMRKRGAGAWMSTAFGLLCAGGTLGIAVGGIGAGIRACMAIAEMKPHPVLLTCAPPVMPHAQARLPPPLPPPAIAPPTPLDLLGATEPETHDPGVLVMRALAMQSAGLPVKLVAVGIPQDAVKKGLGFRIDATPNAGGGIALGSVPKGSLLERAGLEARDVVVSVNGYPAADPKWIDRVRVEPGATTVVELLRDKRRVVLALEWLPDQRR